MHMFEIFKLLNVKNDDYDKLHLGLHTWIREIIT